MSYPVIQANTSILTFEDCVAHLLDVVENGREGLNVRQAIRAVESAYRDFPLKHQWAYYYRKRIVATVDAYSTGTITYDHTGGANERQLTLATGTWPSWSAFGRVIIGDAAYEVESRISDSIITLEESANPGEDVAAGTAYTICRAEYPLPVDFRRMIQLLDIEQDFRLRVDSESEQHDAETVYYTDPSQPLRITIRGSTRHLGSLALVFGPPPATGQNYSMLYEASPRSLRIPERYNTGTVAITSGSATVTGTNTAFPTNCVGAILRVSGHNAEPSPLSGNPQGTKGVYIFQGVIKSRTSATELTLTESAGVSADGQYSLSDPIDIEPIGMTTAFLRLCEAEFERLRRIATWTTTMADAESKIREAIENDDRTPMSASHRLHNFWSTSSTSQET